jgi:hypothetical protein
VEHFEKGYHTKYPQALPLTNSELASPSGGTIDVGTVLIGQLDIALVYTVVRRTALPLVAEEQVRLEWNGVASEWRTVAENEEEAVFRFPPPPPTLEIPRVISDADGTYDVSPANQMLRESQSFRLFAKRRSEDEPTLVFDSERAVFNVEHQNMKNGATAYFTDRSPSQVPARMMGLHGGREGEGTEEYYFYFNPTRGEAVQVELRGTLPRSPLSCGFYAICDWYVANVKGGASMADLHCFGRDNFTNPQVPELVAIREQATHKSDELARNRTHLVLCLKPEVRVCKADGRSSFML